LLQQTAATALVETVFDELIGSYATVRQLAKATSAHVRRLIRPLGLLYRSEELKKLAAHLVKHYHGQIPSSLRELLSCPGLGDYSSRAILVFGYNQTQPIVDTNVARLLVRLTGANVEIGPNPSRSGRLLATASWLLPPRRAADYNFGLLDLCSKVCTASRPSCQICPIKSLCATFRKTREGTAN